MLWYLHNERSVNTALAPGEPWLAGLPRPVPQSPAALQAHAGPQWPGWGAVATSINTEFRRIDKFATGAPGARVIVTDTWVMKVDRSGCCVLTHEGNGNPSFTL